MRTLNSKVLRHAQPVTEMYSVFVWTGCSTLNLSGQHNVSFNKHGTVKNWFIHNDKSLNECRIPYGTQLYVPNSRLFLRTILLSVSPLCVLPFLIYLAPPLFAVSRFGSFSSYLRYFIRIFFISRASLFLIFILLGCFSPCISLCAAFCVSVCLF
jgi:hypothetical protein